jgi:hypothetical protein
MDSLVIRLTLSSGQLVQLRLGLSQIARIEPFSEPSVNRSEKLASFPACPSRAGGLAMLIVAQRTP